MKPSGITKFTQECINHRSSHRMKKTSGSLQRSAARSARFAWAAVAGGERPEVNGVGAAEGMGSICTEETFLQKARIRLRALPPAVHGAWHAQAPAPPPAVEALLLVAAARTICLNGTTLGSAGVRRRR